MRPKTNTSTTRKRVIFVAAIHSLARRACIPTRSRVVLVFPLARASCLVLPKVPNVEKEKALGLTLRWLLCLGLGLQ